MSPRRIAAVSAAVFTAALLGSATAHAQVSYVNGLSQQMCYSMEQQYLNQGMSASCEFDGGATDDNWSLTIGS